MIADLYVRAGEIDQAFEWWDKAYDARDHDMVYIGVATLPDSVRNEPRFQDLLRRMNLPG